MYKPTVRSVRRAYTQLNRLLFQNQLPPSRQIVIKINYVGRSWWAYCRYQKNLGFKIRLRPRYVSRAFFLSILGHEMVHIHEYINYSAMTHGSKFFRFREVFERHGLELKKIYRAEMV